MTLRIGLPRLGILLAVVLGAAACSDSPTRPVRAPDPLKDASSPQGCYLIDGRIYCTDGKPSGP